MYQTAVGRHGDRTHTADSGAVRNLARYLCAIRPVIMLKEYLISKKEEIILTHVEVGGGFQEFHEGQKGSGQQIVVQRQARAQVHELLQTLCMGVLVWQTFIIYMPSIFTEKLLCSVNLIRINNVFTY